MNQLAKSEPAQLAKAETPSVAQMLQVVLAKDITSESVKVIKDMLEIQERVEARGAEKEFARAFNELQAEMPTVIAQKAVPNNDGTVRYNYAPFEDIMRQLAPILKRHGFTVRFSTKFDERRVYQTCIIQHIGGHSVLTEFSARLGKGPPGSSEAQGDGAASTYAKRFALCNALNIVIGSDNDARAEGDTATITQEQADNLRDRVLACGADKDKFLKFAGAAKFEAIPVSKFVMLNQTLTRKEREGK